MDSFVIFERFQVRDHLGGTAQFDGKALFESGCNAMRFPDLGRVRK